MSGQNPAPRGPDRNDKDADEELLRLEQEMEQDWEAFDVKYPSEAEIAETVEAMRSYVPIRLNKWDRRSGA
jgi:hypothetical protein